MTKSKRDWQTTSHLMSIRDSSKPYLHRSPLAPHPRISLLTGVSFWPVAAREVRIRIRGASSREWYGQLAEVPGLALVGDFRSMDFRLRGNDSGDRRS
jgi:hypothetical protein